MLEVGIFLKYFRAFLPTIRNTHVVAYSQIQQNPPLMCYVYPFCARTVRNSWTNVLEICRLLLLQITIPLKHFQIPYNFQCYSEDFYEYIYNLHQTTLIPNNLSKNTRIMNCVMSNPSYDCVIFVTWPDNSQIKIVLRFIYIRVMLI